MKLPDHYPLANAAREEVISWAYTADPPFKCIREAAPWLMTDDQVRCYCEGIREAFEDPDIAIAVGGLFGPALDGIRSRM